MCTVTPPVFYFFPVVEFSTVEPQTSTPPQNRKSKIYDFAGFKSNYVCQEDSRGVSGPERQHSLPFEMARLFFHAQLYQRQASLTTRFQ
jgi:hypothetical protein